MASTRIPRQRCAETVGTTQFTALVHDLRQCLSAALLLSDCPHDESADFEVRRRFELIKQTLTHATAMLDAETGEPAERQPILDLMEIARHCVGVRQYGTKVRLVNEASHPPLVHGDWLMLHRALNNLIDNAGRAAGPSGEVVVSVGSNDLEAWVKVVDDGPGFGEIPHGGGNGLSVVCSTARAGGGRLQIHSGPEPGTTVLLGFPRTSDANAVHQSAEPLRYSSKVAFQSP